MIARSHGHPRDDSPASARSAGSDPGLTQTYETPELLAAAGVKYIGDWVYDDEPTVIRTAKGPLVTLPYTVELNDIPMMIVQHHESDYLFSARSISSTGSTPRASERAKISRLRSTPISAASRTGSNISKRSTIMSRAFDGVLHWNGEDLDWYMSDGQPACPRRGGVDGFRPAAQQGTQAPAADSEEPWQSDL